MWSFDAGFGSSYLARIVGQKKAREIWFLCRKYNTQEALDKRKEQIEFKSELRNLSIQVAKYRNNFIRAMVLNIILVIVIIAMFVILKTSSNPNILNYEVTIQNRYAQWQQELQSEEESLKAREQELNNKKR